MNFNDFTGGLWIPDESGTLVEQAGFAVPSNALLQADNLDYLPSGAVRGRRGSTVYNTEAPLAGPVLARRKYYARPTATERIGIVTGGQSNAAGTAIWTDEAAIAYVFDNPSAARCAILGTVQTQYLVGFRPFQGSPLPPDAAVAGVRARVIAQCGGTAFIPTWTSVTLFKDFAPAGTDQVADAETLSTTLKMSTFGDATNLWGTTLTGGDVNSQGFGVGLSFTATGGANLVLVYWLEVVVYFTTTLPDAFVVCYDNGANIDYARGTGAGFSGITGGTLANPSRRPRIVAWPEKGSLFLFDGVNDVSQYDGQVVATVETARDDTGLYEFQHPRKGPYACLHKNRLYATDPNELMYSVYACDVNNEKAWRPQVQLSANDERGGVVTGLESYGDQLLIFKNTCIFSLLGDPEFGSRQLTRYSELGCVAPNSLAVTPFGVIFVGREGVYLTDGDTVEWLSRPIRPLFVGRADETTFDDAVGVYFPRRNQYWLSLTPGAGDIYVLHRLTVPTQAGDQTVLAWSRIPDGGTMNCGASWDGTGDDGDLYIGDTAGVVWVRDVGAVDDASAYTTTLLTSQRWVDGERRLTGRVNRLKPLYRGSAPLTGAIRYDQAGTDDVAFTVGETVGDPAIQEPRGYILDQVAFGRVVSLRVASSEAYEFELHRLDCDMRARGPRAWR